MALALREAPQQVAAFTFAFTADQKKIILDSFLNGASEKEAAVLMEVARARELNPIFQEIHFVSRWNQQRKCHVWSAQVGIDGFRTLAERTGLYNGQDEAEYQYDKDGNLFSCRVKVYRKGIERPFVGLVFWDEYVQKAKDANGQEYVIKMWREKPRLMIAKCAEAQAFRRAFPRDTSGLYIPEEMPPVEPEIKALTEASVPPPVPTLAPNTEATEESNPAEPVPSNDPEPEAQPTPAAPVVQARKLPIQDVAGPVATVLTLNTSWYASGTPGPDGEVVLTFGAKYKNKKLKDIPTAPLKGALEWASTKSEQGWRSTPKVKELIAAMSRDLATRKDK